MRLIDADVLKEKIKNSDLTNHMKMALLSCVSSMPAVASLPNDPLTLDELREMDGEPVWVVEEKNPHYALITGVCSESLWLTCCEDEAEMLFKEYGKTWLAYRRKPEHSKEA